MLAPYTRILSLGNPFARPAVPARIREAIAACSLSLPPISAAATPRPETRHAVGGGVGLK